jgi:quinohemoprotein ethanol dehydrogenase
MVEPYQRRNWFSRVLAPGISVYDARTGKKLKEIFTGTGIMAAPCTYSIDGEQFIAVMAGYGGAPTCCYPADAVFHEYENIGRIIVFKIGGGVTPLPPKRNSENRPAPPDIKIKEELVPKGAALFYQYCEACHGIAGDGRNSLHPDLSTLPAAKHQLFREIVLGGILAKNGMASFSNSLNAEDVEAIQQFLLKQQTVLYNKQKDQRQMQ